MEPKKKILISLLIIVFLIGTFYFLSYNITRLTGKVILSKSESLGECLKNQNIVLYINSSDTDNELRKTDLIEFLEYFKIKNCIINSKLCEDNGIKEFPTWIINEKKIFGKISISDIQEYSGC